MTEERKMRKKAESDLKILKLQLEGVSSTNSSSDESESNAAIIEENKKEEERKTK